MQARRLLAFILPVIWLAVIQCFELKSSDSFIPQNNSRQPFGTFADIQIRVDVPVQQTLTVTDQRQWRIVDSGMQPSTAFQEFDNVCMEMAVNVDALIKAYALRGQQFTVRLMHWSNASKSLDVELTLIATQATAAVVVQAQLVATIGDENGNWNRLLGPSFGFALSSAASTFIRLTLWIANVEELDMHHIAIWQLLPAEQAWMPAIDYHSRSIQRTNTPQLILFSECVYSTSNVSASGSLPDATVCINNAISHTTTVFPVSRDPLSTALTLRWPTWLIEGRSVFLDGRNALLPAAPFQWHSLSAFTVTRAYTFEDRLMTGKTWSINVCVCRPLACVMQLQTCSSSDVLSLLYVFYNAHTGGPCIDTACYFIDARYVLLTGAIPFFGVMGDNGAVYGVNAATQTLNNTIYLSNLQRNLALSARNAEASINCEPPAQSSSPPPSFIFDQKSSDWLDVLFDPRNAVF